MIARGPQLGYYQSLDATLLHHLASTTIPPAEAGNLTWRVQAEPVEVYGFNATSGLPRLAHIAIRRGSVIEIEGPGAGDLRTRLAACQALGERTWEGFGRFRLDFAPLPEKPESEQAATVPLSDSWSPAARVLEQREAIIKRARDAARDMPGLSRDSTEGPTRTQWEALRQKARVAVSAAELRSEIEDLREQAKTLHGDPWGRVDLSKLGIDHANAPLVEAKSPTPGQSPPANVRLPMPTQSDTYLLSSAASILPGSMPPMPIVPPPSPAAADQLASEPILVTESW